MPKFTPIEETEEYRKALENVLFELKFETAGKPDAVKIRWLSERLARAIASAVLNPKEATIGDLYERASRLALSEIERRARKIMREHKRVTEFVMGMGIASFITLDNLDVDATDQGFKYLQPVYDIIDEWDEYLKLTGNPMRFTADGPVVTDW